MCDAHNGAAAAVATITVRGGGATWTIEVCAQHLEVLEAELGAWAAD